MPTQVIKAILGPTIQDETIDDQLDSTSPSSNLNALSWNRNVFRIINVGTVPTHDHPSSKVQEERNAAGLAVNSQLLLSDVARLRDLAWKTETVERPENSFALAAHRYEEMAPPGSGDPNCCRQVTTWNADLARAIARGDGMSTKRGLDECMARASGPLLAFIIYCSAL